MFGIPKVTVQIQHLGSGVPQNTHEVNLGLSSLVVLWAILVDLVYDLRLLSLEEVLLLTLQVGKPQTLLTVVTTSHNLI